jgi:hypothetical protein
MTKGRFQKGNNFRFGPDWPGQRCGAKTRKGTACQRPAYKRNGRCSLHGGKSAGPKTGDGLARLTAARTTHGKYTKEKRAAAKRFAEQGRQMRAELAELEAWFVDHGHLDKKWRDWFK